MPVKYRKPDADDGLKTDGFHKKWNHEQPLHRIGLISKRKAPPSFRPDLTGPTIDGKGYDRPRGFESCRRPAAVQAAALRRSNTLPNSKLMGAATAELARVI